MYLYVIFCWLKGVCPQGSLKGGKRETPSVVFIYTKVLFCKPICFVCPHYETAAIQLGEGMHACMSSLRNGRLLYPTEQNVLPALCTSQAGLGIKLQGLTAEEACCCFRHHRTRWITMALLFISYLLMLGNVDYTCLVHIMLRCKWIFIKRPQLTFRAWSA